MSKNTVTQAVAQLPKQGPGDLIRRYSTSFEAVLPSHIKPATWIRIAQGALKKGRLHGDSGRFELEVAAGNNPSVFLATLLDAARMGLEPGTDEYYLTARKVKGRLEILGIPGYLGYIELMYRSGAVEAPIAEIVRANDHYRYRRGVDRIPVHEYENFASEKDRGPIVGTYAYAHLRDGGISRVIELNRDDIERIKEKSESARADAKNGTNYSPWNTSEAAMWLKSGVRLLRKWVPTSPEYRREEHRARIEAETQRDQIAPGADVTNEDDAEVYDAELVEDVEWPETAQPPAEEGGDS